MTNNIFSISFRRFLRHVTILNNFCQLKSRGHPLQLSLSLSLEHGENKGAFDSTRLMHEIYEDALVLNVKEIHFQLNQVKDSGG